MTSMPSETPSKPSPSGSWTLLTSAVTVVIVLLGLLTIQPRLSSRRLTLDERYLLTATEVRAPVRGSTRCRYLVEAGDAGKELTVGGAPHHDDGGDTHASSGVDVPIRVCSQAKHIVVVLREESLLAGGGVHHNAESCRVVHQLSVLVIREVVPCVVPAIAVYKLWNPRSRCP